MTLIIRLLIVMMLGFGAMWSTAALCTTTLQMDAQLDNLYGSHADYHTFFNLLQTCNTKKDKQCIARLVRYPIRVMINGKQKKIKHQQAFIRYYNKIITHKVAAAIAKQKYETLFTRDSGVMIGDGEIWFSGLCADRACSVTHIKIIAINN